MGADMALKMRDESGQGVVEYILLIAVIASFFMVVSRGLATTGLNKKLMIPITDKFARAYQFGHTGAKGYEDGGPINHPRIDGGENNFRIFINPYFK